MEQIEIKYIGKLEGPASVIPTGTKRQRILGFSKSVGGDTESAEKQLDDLLAKAEASGHLKSIKFDITPYTYGQQIEASRVSTVPFNGELKTDPNKYNLQLMCASTGKKPEEISGYAPSIAQALLEEVQFISQPDPERLLFLLESPTVGDQKA